MAAEMLERVLLGQSQKFVGYELGQPFARVARVCREQLSSMGCRSLVSRVPMPLVMAVHAAHGWPSHPVSSQRIERDGFRLSLARPEHTVRAELARAELEVVSALIEGDSHAMIAERRRTSARTVANQLASVFRKLHVSSRGELMAHVVRRYTESAHRV